MVAADIGSESVAAPEIAASFIMAGLPLLLTVITGATVIPVSAPTAALKDPFSETDDDEILEQTVKSVRAVCAPAGRVTVPAAAYWFGYTLVSDAVPLTVSFKSALTETPFSV